MGLSLLSVPVLVNADVSVDQYKFKNIIVIVSDDHANHTLGCYGNEIIRTPNLDKLANQGIRFTHSYCNAPISSASRQSLLTGKYPHATGVNLLFTPFNDDKNYTIAEHLKDHGYHTGIIGKTHFNSWIWWKYYNDGRGFPDFGFNESISKDDYKKYLKKHNTRKVDSTIQTRLDYKNDTAIINQWNPRTLPENCYQKDAEGTFFTNKAIEFITKNREQPFFLWLAYHEPHSPFSFPIEFSGKYKPDEIVLPQGSPEDDRFIPQIFRGLDDSQKKGIIASYYTSVEYMDYNIGKLLNALDSLKLDNKTLVVYISDHGYLLYDHKRFEKHTMWEEAIKSPMIIKGFGEGLVCDAQIEFVDLFPTLCEALQLTIPQSVQGKSFYKCLTDPQINTHKKIVFCEFLEDNKAMVSTKKWKYIFTTGKRDLGLAYKTGFGPTGVLEKLYDLENDPGESQNIAKNKENQAVLQNMRKQMLEIFKQTHPEAKEVPQKLNIIGKLIWFCEPRDVGAEPGLPLQRVFEKFD